MCYNACMKTQDARKLPREVQQHNRYQAIRLFQKGIVRKEIAEIYWGDGTGVRNDCQHSRGYAPKGRTPIVEINAKRFSIPLVSAINNQGLVCFMTYKETMAARVLMRFMQRLEKDPGRKVYLILDNLWVHHA